MNAEDISISVWKKLRLFRWICALRKCFTKIPLHDTQGVQLKLNHFINWTWHQVEYITCPWNQYIYTSPWNFTLQKSRASIPYESIIVIGVPPPHRFLCLASPSIFLVQLSAAIDMQRYCKWYSSWISTFSLIYLGLFH